MEALVHEIRAGLAARRDTDRAVAMQRYMKTTMPMFGVAKPERAQVVRAALLAHPITTAADHRAAVTALWRGPERELKYVAITIACRQTRFVTVENLDLYRSMIVEGAWWDLVDEFAHALGHLLRADRATMRPVLDEWIDDDDMWLRRIAILSQLDLKSETDEEMLFSYCLRRMGEREFFIRKAIGWALRQYARTAPDAVRTFCIANRAHLSGLSFREAMKHLGPAEAKRTSHENP